jgi:hypothetical protein
VVRGQDHRQVQVAVAARLQLEMMPCKVYPTKAPSDSCVMMVSRPVAGCVMMVSWPPAG